MAISAERRIELAAITDRAGERAAELHLDGHHREALDLADLAVEAIRELHAEDAGDARVADVLAARLRTSAEIRRELGRSLKDADFPAATALYRRGVEDAQAAIELYEASREQQYPLLLPSLRLLLAEFQSAVGDHAPAAANADRAVDDYRRRGGGGEDAALHLGHALSRYADVLDMLGASERARQARRESVAAYRPHVRPGSVLWDRRDGRGTTWVSTPTLLRFAVTAELSVRDLRPSPAHAAEALVTLQDAVEAFAALVPLSAWFPGPEEIASLQRVQVLVQQVQRWLVAVGETRLVGEYEAMMNRFLGCATTVRPVVATAAEGGCVELVRALRPALERVVAGLP